MSNVLLVQFSLLTFAQNVHYITIQYYCYSESHFEDISVMTLVLHNMQVELVSVTASIIPPPPHTHTHYTLITHSYQMASADFKCNLRNVGLICLNWCNVLPNTGI